MKNLSAEYLSNAVRANCEADVYELYQQWETSRRYVRAAGLLLVPGALNDDQQFLDLVSFINTAPFVELVDPVMRCLMSSNEFEHMHALRNRANRDRVEQVKAAKRDNQIARFAAVDAFDRVRGKFNRIDPALLDFDHPLVQAAAEAETESIEATNADYQAALDAIEAEYEKLLRTIWLLEINATYRYA